MWPLLPRTVAPLPRALASSGSSPRRVYVFGAGATRTAQQPRREIGAAMGKRTRKEDPRAGRREGSGGERTKHAEARRRVDARGGWCWRETARGTERKVLRERRTAPWRWPLRGNRTAARSGKIEDLCETPFTSINATLCCPPVPVTYLKIAIARFSPKSRKSRREGARFISASEVSRVSTYQTIDSETFDRISSIDMR